MSWEPAELSTLLKNPDDLQSLLQTDRNMLVIYLHLLAGNLSECMQSL